MVIERYLEVVRDGLAQLLALGAAYAVPVALCLGVLWVMGVIAWSFGRREWSFEARPALQLAGGVGALALVLWIGASSLRATRFLAQRELRMQDRAQATSNPLPDAPPVVQTGPAVAALRERTYASTLTLPRSFLNRLGADGLNVLAPYLSDPSAANVVRLRNSFKRSGQSAVFSRQVTTLEEQPLPFADSKIKVAFKRLPGRAFECAFEASYKWKNSAREPRLVHFLFSLPQAGTVRDLQVRVGTRNLQPATDAQGDSGAQNAEPSDPDTLEWRGTMAPGEVRQATVSYLVTGARTWNYDLGSTRRRVESFGLDADTGGDVRFARGSLQPSFIRANQLSWNLQNVVTAQSLALVFPSDRESDQLYIQALTALPLCLLLLAGGVWAFGSAAGAVPPSRIALAAAVFTLGLGGASIQTSFAPLVLLLLAPLAGAVAACAVLGRRFALVAVPVALLPATFLSAHHTGSLVLALFVTTGALIAVWTRRNRAR